ncbi:MAG: hypothetical protein JWP96_1328 [Polaromonas sp.]|nr:hypothetical protein [Polaromonas sp.]
MPSTFAPKGLLFAGVLCAASGQADTVAAHIGATIIAPVNVMTSWADFPVTVSRSGGWISVLMPSVQLPASLSNSSASLNEEALAIWRIAIKSTLHGEFTTFLSAPKPLGGGRYSVTVNFN